MKISKVLASATPSHSEQRSESPDKSFYSKILFAGVLFKHAPPLPIPNREVKVFESDDTWIQSDPGKVGYAGI